MINESNTKCVNTPAKPFQPLGDSSPLVISTCADYPIDYRYRLHQLSLHDTLLFAVRNYVYSLFNSYYFAGSTRRFYIVFLAAGSLMRHRGRMYVYRLFVLSSVVGRTTTINGCQQLISGVRLFPVDESVIEVGRHRPSSVRKSIRNQSRTGRAVVMITESNLVASCRIRLE